MAQPHCHFRARWRLAAVALAAALLGACAGQVPEPTAAHVAVAAAEWPGTTRETLARGRTLYVYRCSGCHSLVLPGAQTPEEWPNAVYEMSERAALSRAETDAVVRYLVAVSETLRRGRPHAGGASAPQR